MWESIKSFNRRHPGLLPYIIGAISLAILLRLGGANSLDSYSIVIFPSIGLGIYYLRKYMK